MANYNFDDVFAGTGTLNGFDPFADTLTITGSASSVTAISDNGTDTSITRGSSTIVITGVLTHQFTNTNLLASDGSQFYIGDDNASADITGDNAGRNLDLSGSVTDDFVMTFAGQDTIIGGSGNDRISSGDGDDIVSNSRNGWLGDTLSGGNGNDTIFAQWEDILSANNDGDFIVFVPPDASVSSSTGFLSGFSTNDRIDLRQIPSIDFIGSEEFTGAINQVRYEKDSFRTYLQLDSDGDGSSDHVINFSNRINVVETSPGSDVLQFALTNTILGTGGADTLVGSGGPDSINGFDGADVLLGNGGDDTINGGGGNDSLNGGAGNDSLLGGDGNDTFIGSQGIDTIDGGSGRNTVDYSAFLDDLTIQTFSNTMNNVQIILSGAGNDSLEGNAENNFFFGGDGNDTLAAGGGNNTLNGGLGFDYAKFSFGPFNINLATGTAAGFNGQQFTFVGVEGILGTFSNDTIVGNSIANDLQGDDGNDVIRGDAGNDTLSGGDNNDTLFGDAGNDSIDGGDGNDSLIGGAGSDSFAFFRRSGEDQIVDLEINDFVDLSKQNYFPFFGLPSTFIGTQAFSNAANEVRYTKAADKTYIFTDSDGDGTSDHEIEIQNGAFDLVETFAGSGILGIAGNVSKSGGNARDTIYGGLGNDTLLGGDGNDFVSGGGGNNLTDGGRGLDWLSYDFSRDSVIAILDARYKIYNAGDAALDTYSNFEGLVGTDFDDLLAGDNGLNGLDGGRGNDELIGLGGVDYLIGGEGDDTLSGGDGADWLFGDDGSDTASYRIFGGAVTASLANPNSNTAHARGDKYFSIENLEGSLRSDRLIGDSSDNILSGLSGADTLSGGGGFDTASYEGAGIGVTAVLLSGFSNFNSGHAAGDRYISIEGLMGSSKDDLLAGDAGANSIFGGAGNDEIFGVGGDDTLEGGSGNDTLNGGLPLNPTAAGNDQFVFRSGSGHDVIVGFDAGENSTDVILLDMEPVRDGFLIEPFDTFTEVQGIASDAGGNTILNFHTGDSLTLIGVNSASLHQDDFVFL